MTDNGITSPYSSPFETIVVQVPASIKEKLGTLSLKDDVTAATFESKTNTVNDDTESLVSSLSEIGFSSPGNALSPQFSSTFRVQQWDRKRHYSDLIREGLTFLNQEQSKVTMLFESPSSCSHETSFFNGQTFKFHDYPPSAPVHKSLFAPCRYTMMNGNSFPSFLKSGTPPAGLVDHWKSLVPDFVEPTFVSNISEDDTVYAYLPVEQFSKYVNDPHVHYHLCGKDVLHLMTQNTPKLLTNTRDLRPCICKTTHSMASKGIYIIHNDDDEREFERFLAESGNPTYVITEFVEIERNVACHFFIHPNGKDIVWIGSNENFKNEEGVWSSDSIIDLNEQAKLRELQLPFVQDVAKYFHSHRFWGFCGVDVLFDKYGKGYLVDVNPRCTGSSPALMVAQRLKQKFGYDKCIFRRSSKYAFNGTSKELVKAVEAYNVQNVGTSMILLTAFSEQTPKCTLLEMGIFGNRSFEEFQTVLDHFTVLKHDCLSE